MQQKPPFRDPNPCVNPSKPPPLSFHFWFVKIWFGTWKGKRWAIFAGIRSSYSAISIQEHSLFIANIYRTCHKVSSNLVLMWTLVKKEGGEEAWGIKFGFNVNIGKEGWVEGAWGIKFGINVNIGKEGGREEAWDHLILKFQSRTYPIPCIPTHNWPIKFNKNLVYR